MSDSPRDEATYLINRSVTDLRQINGVLAVPDAIALTGVRADLAKALAILDLADAVRSLDGAPGYEMADPE